MKTIQAVARYFPEKCGGIHIHLSELLPVLKSLGVESKVAASQDLPTEDHYTYRDTEVYRYPVSPQPKSEPNHGAIAHGGFDYFAQWLKAQQADVYHQHQWTPKCGLPHLRLAKELGMATVVSVRLPQPICQRQTMMLHGETACDGKIDVVRCSRCCGVSSDLPPAIVKGLSHTPMPISVAAAGILRRLNSGSVRPVAEATLRPIAIPAFVAARQYGLQEMAQFADRIIVMSEWVRQALMINGIPEEKLFLLKHGISDTFAQQKVAHVKRGDRLRVGFLGRWAHDKGIHVLVEAIKRLPEDFPIELILHGVPQDAAYRERITARIGDDSRIRVAKELSRSELPQALAGFDVLAVPSQWLETGPVVVLEAHAHGLPVIGSDLGGIAEKVNHGVDGLLVAASDPGAWAEAFARLTLDEGYLNQLRAGIQPVRTISMEAAESLMVYQSVLAKQSAAGNSWADTTSMGAGDRAPVRGLAG